MPRINTRNLQIIFEQMELDRRGQGPNVSDDIQMTYNMGDWERYTQGQLGQGAFTFGVSGRSGFLEVEVLAPRGMIFWSMLDHAPIVANDNNNFYLIRTQAVPVVSPDRDERPWAIVEGPPPLSKFTRGTTADAKVGLVQKRGILGTGMYTSPLYSGTPGLWVRNGRFLVIHANKDNQVFSPFVICSELGRDSRPPAG